MFLFPYEKDARSGENRLGGAAAISKTNKSKAQAPPPQAVPHDARLCTDEIERDREEGMEHCDRSDGRGGVREVPSCLLHLGVG